MGWLLSRLFVAMAVTAACGFIGFLVGSRLGHPVAAAVAAAAMGAALPMLFEALKALRLMTWLRGPQEGAAPRDRGFWGELAYRIERSIVAREKALELERGRLGQFLSAIEASPNGVLLLDADEGIRWMNRVAADHFGLEPLRDREQRVTNLVRAPAFVAHLQQDLFDEPVRMERPRGGGTLAVLVRPYGDGLKLVLTQDVTERERSDAMRRDFVANVSHEIRTPLTVLAGFVETLATLPLSEVELKRVFELMRQQTGRMQTLVADLLQLAQLEGSPRPPADRWVPLNALLERLSADAHALSAGRHALHFAVESGASLAGIETELASAFANLVGNAIRYTPAGGTIDVHWRVADDGRGEFEVSDTGIGIAREHLPRLTERFYRVDGSRSRDTGGTGLGLSIVKHVVQRHGGELDIRSEPGKGSRFRLLFPASRVRSAAPVEP